MGRQIAGLLGTIVVIALAACSVRGPGPGASSPGATDDSPVSPAATGPVASGPPTPSPAGSPDEQRVLDALGAMLELEGARVTYAVDRWKGEEGPERLVAASGEMQPSAGRGRFDYDLTALLGIPGDSPDPNERFELAWDATHLWLRGDSWEERTRDDARIHTGLLGRFPDEVLGLVRVTAAAEPADVSALPPDPERPDTERWLVSVPVDSATSAGVPADAPNADVVRSAYGIEAIPVEVWLEHGDVTRLRFTLSRERALYGGPDRSQVTYDWVSDPTVRIVIPPTD